MTDEPDYDDPKIAAVAAFEWEAVDHPEPDWPKHSATWLKAQQLTWLVMTKTKPQLVKIVRGIDEDTLDQVHSTLDYAVRKAKADVDMAIEARSRMIAAGAVLVMEVIAEKGEKE